MIGEVIDPVERYAATDTGVGLFETGLGVPGLAELKDSLTRLRALPPEATPYAHPYHWAAFTAWGYDDAS